MLKLITNAETDLTPLPCLHDLLEAAIVFSEKGCFVDDMTKLTASSCPKRKVPEKIKRRIHLVGEREGSAEA